MAEDSSSGSQRDRSGSTVVVAGHTTMPMAAPAHSSQAGSAPPPARDVDEPLPLGNMPRARRKASRHRVPSQHERAGRKAGVPVKSISLSVPLSVATAWRAHGQTQRHSLVDVMLDAIKSNEARLPELVRERQAAERAGKMPVSDGLFLRTSTAGPDDEPLDPFVTMPLRLLSTNVDVLDSLAYQAAAENRSQLVVAALTPFLVERGVLLPAPEAAPVSEA